MNYTKENIILVLAVIGSLVFLIFGFKPGRRISFFDPYGDKSGDLTPVGKVISYICAIIVFIIVIIHFTSKQQ
jgi:hypothetical protein